MKKNYRKRILPLALAAVLSLTSCEKDDNLKDEYQIKTRNIIEAYDNNEENREKERLNDFFKGYIDRYGSYLSEEQYNSLVDIMEVNYGGHDPFPYKITRKLLNEMTSSSENEFGRGLGRAFNLRLVYENIFSSWMIDDDVYEEFNTLRSVVNDDDTFYSCLFSHDMDGLIECIHKQTGLSESKIEQLILIMDAYSDIQESEEYNDVELKETYKKSIEELMSELVKSKLESDEEFASTLYGKFLSNSKYYGSYNYRVTVDLFDEDASISGYKDTLYYNFSIPSEYLKTKMSIEEAKEYAVCDIIKNGDKEDNYYENDAMTLMIHLIDPSTLTSDKLTNQEKREILYDNLKDEFKTIEDFDDFFLTIANGSSMIYYDYFTILENRIEKDGITYDDFVRFTSLANFMNDNEDICIDWNWDVDYPPYEEIKKMPEEEYDKIVNSFSTSWIFDGMDYKMCMEMVYDLIKKNDLGYEQLYSPNCKYEYKYGVVGVSTPSPSVVSSLVEPKIGTFQGHKVVYYEVPENYETGKAVDCFYNIERKLTVVEIPGIFSTIFDEEKGREVTIFIRSIDGEIEENQPSIRFMEYYYYYLDKQDNKKLTLEAK